jgi:hypothetical protein
LRVGAPDYISFIPNPNLEPNSVKGQSEELSYPQAGASASDMQFSLGVTTVSMDSPYQRTKVVIVVDRFILMNTTSQLLEVRQAGCNNILTLGSGDMTPMWWRSGSQLVQIRLKGWSWSGKFSLRTEGETPLRLRNERDNNAFFVSLRVVKQGPRECVVFRGGERGGAGMAPYRIENHTLETFQLKQADRRVMGIFVPSPAVTTAILPHHVSLYAWDEPLDSHSFVLDSVTHIQGQAESQYTHLGTYSFDELRSYTTIVHPHLVFKIVAVGPNRVLQILDIRTMAYSSPSAPIGKHIRQFLVP